MVAPVIQPIANGLLRRTCDAAAFKFATTAELEDIDPMATQDRAAAAIGFGTEIAADDFNLFVIGQSRASMDAALRTVLGGKARSVSAPDDWIYVNNFSEPHKPVAIRLPPGRAPSFREAMRELVDDLKIALPAAFESEDYQARRGAIEQAFADKQEEAFKKLNAEATRAGIVVMRTPMGFSLAPTKDGQVMRPDVFQQLPEAEQRRTQEAMAALESKLGAILKSVPGWDKERRTQVRELDRETTRNAVDHLIEEVREKFGDLAAILEHVERVREDLVENIGLFVAPRQEGGQAEGDAVVVAPFARYEVNLLVARPEADGAPVVEELHPTLANLVGRIEHIARQGALVTDFRLIKPGALHRANGGYLLLDARAVLSEPFAWTALKRTLKAGRIRIESAVDLMSLTTTVSLEPDPIPLDVKVVLVGERHLYFLLAELDPEFSEHFKVLADFDDQFERDEPAELTYARLVATIARQRGLMALDREGVAAAIEHASRLAGDAGKLTLVSEKLIDLLVEADYYARNRGAAVVGVGDIDRTVREQTRRMSRIRDRMQEATLREVWLVETAGEAVGQVNGLSVLEMAGFAFGRPSRITARVSPGGGKVVDIEREVKLGGPIHSKGVLILSGFLSGRYARDAPISLNASLVFEQSYGGVEGDSASSAELYALLSAIAEVPLRQDLAVTGSVNQHGVVQAIGGVNEKIEGFFDLCSERGLTGTQGVLIPAANTQHLMLRRDVVEACAQGRFAVYSIRTVDEGIALLAGRAAGERGADGLFPAGSINGLVEERLRRFAEARRAFARADGGEERKDER